MFAVHETVIGTSGSGMLGHGLFTVPDNGQGRFPFYGGSFFKALAQLARGKQFSRLGTAKDSRVPQTMGHASIVPNTKVLGGQTILCLVLFAIERV